MKLIVDDVSELDTFPVRPRPVARVFHAVRMPHDFEVVIDAESGASVAGNAGEWVVIDGPSVVVLLDEAFKAAYSRVLAPRAPK